MAVQTQLQRQWHLLMRLESDKRGATVDQLTAELHVSEKTIRRDLIALRKIGFPLEETNGPHGEKTWTLTTPAGIPPLGFSFIELASLYLGRELIEPLAGTSLWEGAHNAFRKIKAALGPPAIRHLERLTTAVHHTKFGRGDYSRQAEIVDTLMVGIEDRRIASITYQSLRATEPVSYDVNSLGLIYHKQSLYLVADSPSHNELRHFKVDRISDAALLELKFQRPTDFCLSDLLNGSFGVFQGKGKPQRVRVRFAPEAVRHVQEKQWHGSQRLAPQPDGGLIATFELTDSTELKSWVLSYGTRAEVLEPASLRLEISETIQQLAQVYAESGSPSPSVRKRVP